MSNIKLFEEKKVRSVYNEQEEKWYFSVQDVVQILTDSNDVKQYIKKMLTRDEQLKNNWGTICTLVEMKANKIENQNNYDQLKII
jgi:prophage antirepressor-like protein